MAWHLGKKELRSRFLLGTAQYPSPEILQQAIKAADAEVITVSLRRAAPEQKSGESFWQWLQTLPCHILPNTAGARTAKEAINTALMAREIFNTNWIKLEVIGDDYFLQPDPFGLLEATRELIQQDFIVFPYCTDDLIVCEKLVSAGCEILMPWASPIGSGQGIIRPHILKLLRQRFPHIQLIVDAGIGAPSHAAHAMELGFDGVLLNTAVALANDPIQMAAAFANAIEAGRTAFQAGLMSPREFAHASTPIMGTPFWQQIETEKKS